MRLGDLDALKQELVSEMVKCMRMSEESKGSMAERVLNRVDEAPTIEAEPVNATDTNVGSKWIPVTERPPEESDADKDGRVFAVLRREVPKVFHWSLVRDYPTSFTHWMPLPKPPESDPTKERLLRSCEQIIKAYEDGGAENA